MSPFATACYIVAIILGILAAIPAVPYGSSLLGGAVAFTAAGHVVP